MIKAALVGNPNVGKTTLFNLLTGSNQYIGNWPGVTIEKKEGYLGKELKVIDLPGIYAFDTFSNEEKISKRFLLDEKPDIILNIVDATNLNRNLYLTLQLLQFNIPMLLIVNMIDAAESKGIKIDCNALSLKLNLPVIPISASKKIGTDEVKKLIQNGVFFKPVNDNNFHYDDEQKIYSYIEEVLKGCITYSKNNNLSLSEKIDKIILNKYLAYPIFGVILFLIFKFTFSWVGQPLSDLLDNMIYDEFLPWLDALMVHNDKWFKSFITDGVVGGVGAVLVFLPIILSLFLCISFLEDSGYMARAALIMDKLMRKIGLSGKAFIPLIIGFGCSVPAILSTRTLESEKDRKLTALLVPLMSCNARLPVYALFASVFFPGKQTSIVFSLYLLGIAAAFLMGILFKNTIFKKEEEPFIIELPDYKMPSGKNLLLHTWKKGESFLKKMGTVIFSASVIVWFLSNFSIYGLTDINSSFLSYIGRFLSPIFTPIGFSNWQVAVSLLTGVVAKEVVVSTMGVLLGSDLKSVLFNYFTPASAYSFLVFVLLYTPCISTVATIRKEYGKNTMLISIIYQILLAWSSSFIVFNILKLI